MLLVLYIWTVLLNEYCYGLTPNDCSFNSMCVCSLDENDYSSKTIHSVSCLSVPFYKFPTLPEGSISHLEVVGTKITILESESLAGCQVQALILTNNHIQHISDRSFSTLSKSITSLDLSYNKLDSIPFSTLKDVRNLQWMNLHGNEISSFHGFWSHMKNSITTLFLGENDLTVIPNDLENNINPNGQTGLSSFKSLIWLNLDGNRIHRIDKDSLPSCLKTASLSHNLITDFPVDIILTSSHLQWLYLRGNHIRLLPQFTFPQVKYLEKIDLAENYISTLPSYLFNNSLKIRDMNLAFNDFRMLTDNSFSGLNTGRIILSYNSIEKMDFDAFNGIINTLEYLDLDHNHLQRIPDALRRLSSLKYLYLSRNYLKYLPSNVFDNFSHTLKALSLSGNQFNEIPTAALLNCSKISHFNMAFNEIFDLVEEDLYWGSNIKSLILSNNRLTRLRGNVFNNLENLKELSLSFNPLRIIDKDAFAGLENLESLEMSFSLDSTDLHHEIFNAPFNNLKWLSLDHNNIKSFNISTTVKELTYLNLEFNKIYSIPTFVNPKLRDVRLSNNEIKIIETNTFRNLIQLETILLSNNQIETIQKESFTNLSSITSIIIAHNALKRIDNDAFCSLPNVNRLDFFDNSLEEISFNIFTNVSSILNLNLSRNDITKCMSDSRVINIQTIDFRYNNFIKIPNCIQHTSGLKKFFIDFNIINDLDNNGFMHLTSLEYLGLQQNNIQFVAKRAFYGLQSLQILDLSKNLIGHLHVGQFANMSQLRILNLSGNHLSYLPKEIFKSTHIEMLDLSYNRFSVVPSTSLSDIGISLRLLSIKSNNIEHIDITTFPDIPLLQQLDLRNNKLTILPDNVFTSLGLLQFLDLSSNPLRSNFKELFHYAQTLRLLDLSNSGIEATPYFPLPNLVHLNLSYNNIEYVNKRSFLQLTKLKTLILSHNNINIIPAYLWAHVPRLKYLDLSYNPIREISAESFTHLHNLQYLNLQHLDKLVKFESDAFLQLKIISKLSIQVWPNIENFSEKLCHLFSHTDQLRVLQILFVEKELTDQLLCVTNSKIRHLEITGRSLKSISKDALIRFTKNPQLLIKIHHTKIEELPSGLFANMFKIAHLTLDLRNNLLTHLHPEIFYGNSTRWKNVGTTLISGGLLLSDNPFRCDCHLSWLSHWLRRWTRESLQSHNSPIELAMTMNEGIREATCIDYKTGSKVSIVDLHAEHMNCHASALSNGTYSNGASVIFIVLLFVLKHFR